MCKAKVAGNIWFSYNSSPNLESKKILLLEFTYCESNFSLVQLGKGQYKIKLTSEAEEKVNASRNLIDRIVKENRVVYGITTGFGKFARTVIEKGNIFQSRGVINAGSCSSLFGDWCWSPILV